MGGDDAPFLRRDQDAAARAAKAAGRLVPRQLVLGAIRDDLRVGRRRQSGDRRGRHGGLCLEELATVHNCGRSCYVVPQATSASSLAWKTMMADRTCGSPEISCVFAPIAPWLASSSTTISLPFGSRP